MMRVVVDTNVLVRCTSASLGGPAWDVLQRLLKGGHAIITAEPQWSELLDVFDRPQVRVAFQLTDDQLTQFLTHLHHTVEFIELPDTSIATVPHDPKDVPVLLAAIAGRADVICSRDRHLLHAEVLAACRAHGIRVLSDLELLHELRSVPPGDP